MSATISGSGGRMHCVEQAASLNQLADEVERDLKYWSAHMSEEECQKVAPEATARVKRLRAEARKLEWTVYQYDAARGGT